MDARKRNILFGVIVCQAVVTVYFIGTFSRSIADDRYMYVFQNVININVSTRSNFKNRVAINKSVDLGQANTKTTHYPINDGANLNTVRKPDDNERVTSSTNDTMSKPIISQCKHVKCPLDLATNGSWQYVAPDYAIVFSAFYIDESASVVVVAARVKRIELPVCYLWFENATYLTMVEVSSSAMDFPESKGRR